MMLAHFKRTCPAAKKGVPVLETDPGYCADNYYRIERYPRLPRVTYGVCFTAQSRKCTDQGISAFQLPFFQSSMRVTGWISHSVTRLWPRAFRLEES